MQVSRKIHTHEWTKTTGFSNQVPTLRRLSVCFTIFATGWHKRFSWFAFFSIGFRDIVPKINPLENLQKDFNQDSRSTMFKSRPTFKLTVDFHKKGTTMQQKLVFVLLGSASTACHSGHLVWFTPLPHVNKLWFSWSAARIPGSLLHIIGILWMQKKSRPVMMNLSGRTSRSRRKTTTSKIRWSGGVDSCVSAAHRSDRTVFQCCVTCCITLWF